MTSIDMQDAFRLLKPECFAHATCVAVEPIVAGLLVLVCAGASFFFALAETALFSLSRLQVRQITGRKEAAGEIVVRLLAEPQDLLATMVLGNTFANAGMLAIGLW